MVTAKACAFLLDHGKVPTRDRNNTVTKKVRWSAMRDSARLLMVMFHSEKMRQDFIMTKQPLSREEMDNRILPNRVERYWHAVQEAFNKPDYEVITHVPTHLLTHSHTYIHTYIHIHRSM